MSRTRTRSGRRGAVRLNGLVVLMGIVLLGLASGAAYFHYKQPQIHADYLAELEAAPTTTEGKLALWHEFGAPQIHGKITISGRFSSEHPWLITHAVSDPAGGDPTVWGIDLETLPNGITRVEEWTVVLELPAPRALGRIPLVGDNAPFVPVYASNGDVPDPRGRLEHLARWFIDPIPAALADDIEGARFEVRIAEG